MVDAKVTKGNKLLLTYSTLPSTLSTNGKNGVDELGFWVKKITK